MVTAYFGSAIGSKFNSDGTFRHFPGNTMVSALRSNPVFPRLCSIQERLLEDGRGKYLIPLPPSSFHMTVFEGVCDEVRDSAHWTALASAVSPLEDVTAILEPLFYSVLPMGKVVMKLSSLRIDTGVSIALVPFTSEDEKTIRDYRDRLKARLRIAFPDHDEYRFHIGLAYGRMNAGRDDVLFSSFQQEVRRYLEKNEITFTVPPPDFCTFSDMSSFTPVVKGARNA